MRRIGILVVGLLVLGAVPAAAGEPDVVRQGDCSGRSRWRLELTDTPGNRIRVRFEVHNSLDQPWRIVLRHGRAGPDPFDHGDGRVFFEGTRSQVGFFSTGIGVQASVRDLEGDDGFAAKAVDQETGQLCHVHIRMSVGVSHEAPASQDSFRGLYRATFRPVPGTQCGDTISRRVEVFPALGGSQSVRRIDFVHSTHGSDRLRYVAGKLRPWRTADAFIALRYRPSTNSAVGIWHGICDSRVHLVPIG